ncbi:hypothetical protein TB2_006721 [Malus domestica]
MEDIEIEVPQYFICPISLQIMKDPVTVVTGITYDRESIEHWFLATNDLSCPVTKQALPRGAGLTPNHTLRRLIQQWCKENATNGVDLIPTPRLPLDKIYLTRLVRDLGVSHLQLTALKKLEALVLENDERTRFSMAEAGVAKAVILLVIRCFRGGETNGLLEAFRILHHVWNVSGDNEVQLLVNGNTDFLDSLTWVFRCGLDQMDNHLLVKNEAILVSKMTMEVLSPCQLERLNLEFFKNIVMVLKEKISLKAVKSALHILINACPWGRNRIKIVESGAVFRIIELELAKPEKRVTELIFNLLANLCGCADGRDQLLKHGGGMAMVSKRILRVSPATDDPAVHILSSIAMFSATHNVLSEMLLVGAVSKLCMVMQSDCEAYLKKKVRGILRLHSNVWNNSPCIAVYLITRPRW